MGLFSRRKLYKKIVEGIARDAFQVDLLASPGLAGDGNGFVLNTLEGVAAVVFMTQHAFLALDDAAKYEKARDYLAQLVFADLEADYSKVEMRNLVLPLLERRHHEYSAILGSSSGTAGDRIRELFEAIIGHCIEESVEETRTNMAGLYLFNRLMTEPARKLKSMDNAGEIAW